MTYDELLERLRGHEWNDIEFKAALRDVPKSAYETVAAFCNTAGGWLVFGVGDSNGTYQILGVVAVDKVQNDFLTVLRSGQKFNRLIDVHESMITDDGKTLLVFYIPEVHRRDKPIFLDGDLRRSFIRKGGGDVRCSENDIRRLMLDASDERYDSQPLELDVDTCFDSDALRWYRDQFSRRNPARDPSISDVEFMRNWGFITDYHGAQLPVRAAILLFGSQPALIQVLPRPVADCQWINAEYGEELPDERWSDRAVLESNLVQSWRSLGDFYVRHAERAFNLEPTTFQRTDVTPDYIAFREAAINLLIHQNYADHTRKGLVQFFRDRAVFFNPGDAFVRTSELLDPGDKEVRNPRIVHAFRRIGLSEAAGTGVQTVYKSWRELGRVPPIIENDRADKTFRLTLPKEELLSDSQFLFEASLGVHLNEEETTVFAYACREKRISLMDVKAVTGFTRATSIRYGHGVN